MVTRQASPSQSAGAEGERVAQTDSHPGERTRAPASRYGRLTLTLTSPTLLYWLKFNKSAVRSRRWKGRRRREVGRQVGEGRARSRLGRGWTGSGAPPAAPRTRDLHPRALEWLGGRLAVDGVARAGAVEGAEHVLLLLLLLGRERAGRAGGRAGAFRRRAGASETTRKRLLRAQGMTVPLWPCARRQWSAGDGSGLAGSVAHLLLGPPAASPLQQPAASLAIIVGA